MSESCYLLVFNGMLSGADTARIVSYLQKDLGLSHRKQQYVINNSPCVLHKINSMQVAELAMASLSALGCMVACEPAVIYPHLAFVISHKHERSIRREMSKAQRAMTSLVLMCIRVDPCGTRTDIPSLLGAFEEQICDHFRESDTVLIIDEARLIVVGFATDQIGAEFVRRKALHGLASLLGSDVEIVIGSSIFPHEGQTIEELLYLASKRKEAAPVEPVSNHIESAVSPGVIQESQGGFLDSSDLKLCFSKARGTVFDRLLSLEPKILWGALSQIPQIAQQEFLARLPFNAPLSAALGQCIAVSNSSTPETALSEEHHFRAIIRQLGIDESLKERITLHQEVMAKLSNYEDLPTLPSVATQIYSIASDQNSSANDLAEIITKDPALTSKLLKTVNSAFYGSPQQISSVKQAVVLLGMDEIVGIAFGLAAAKVFDVKAVVAPINPKRLWRHSVRTALIAQHICSKLPQYRTMGAFTAGLLHDVGKIFLIEKFPEEYGLALSNNPGSQLPLFEFEDERFGLNHAAIGKMLSAEWNMPEPLVQAITYHHHPLNADSHGGFAALIGLADYLSHRITSIDADPSAVWLSVGHQECLAPVYNNLTEQVLDDMVREIDAMFETNGDNLADSH